jgi:hypothetical protein
MIVYHAEKVIIAQMKVLLICTPMVISTNVLRVSSVPKVLRNHSHVLLELMQTKVSEGLHLNHLNAKYVLNTNFVEEEVQHSCVLMVLIVLVVMVGPYFAQLDNIAYKIMIKLKRNCAQLVSIVLLAQLIQLSVMHLKEKYVPKVHQPNPILLSMWQVVLVENISVMVNV